MARIAMMLESDGPGGAENVMLHLSSALRERGHEITPVGPAEGYGYGWLGDEFRKIGFTPSSFTLRRPLDWKCLRGLIRLLRKEEIDLVHSHEFTMAVYGAAAARYLGIPHVITMHGGRRHARHWRRRASLRWACRGSRRVIAVSSATRSDLLVDLGLTGGSVSVIRNGIPARAGDRRVVRRELGLSDRDILILAVGNLYPVKGHIVLLRALTLLPPELRALPWRVVIAGRGAEEEELRTFAREHGLAERVLLAGFRPDVPDLLAGADIFTLPSLSEGLPLALVEAMHAGKPVIASRVGGIPEVVRDVDAGLLVPPDAPGPLADALALLLGNPSLRHAMGGRAREVAEADFGIDSMALAYEEAYGLNAPVRRSRSPGLSVSGTR